jgi:hypothetical protein
MASGVLTRPTLETGDNLTREEFIRIWDQLPHIKRAELIGGIVYMPALTTSHGGLDFSITGWLSYYQTFTPGCDGGSNESTFMLKDCPQPDVNLRVVTEYGGKSWIEDDYLCGSPELLTEVCNSTESIDLHQKLEIYEEAGVQEYLVVIAKKKQIRWHQLVRTKYKLIAPDADGVFRSVVFPGLWLDSKALFKNDMEKVLKTLQKGINSIEHHRFIDELAKRKK